MDELEDEQKPSGEKESAARSKETPAPSPVDVVIDKLSEEFVRAKMGTERTPDGMDIVVRPADRLAMTLAVRDYARDLAEMLQKQVAESGSVKDQDRLERTEMMMRDAESMAAISPALFGVDANDPAVLEKLTENRARLEKRGQASDEELKQILARKQSRPMSDQAVSAEQLSSLSDKSALSPFAESSAPQQEPTGVGIAPTEYVEDKDIMGTAEDLDEMNVELGGAETELTVLDRNKDVPGRTERLQGLLDKAEKLSMRAAEAGQAEPLRPLDQKEVSPQMKTIQDLDLRATRLLLRTREAVREAQGEKEPTVSDYVRPVSESQLSPLESAESEVKDVFEDLPEPTVVTGQVPDMSVGPDESTRIRPLEAKTVVTEAPTEEEKAA